MDGDVLSGYFGKGAENLDNVTADVADTSKGETHNAKKIDNKEGFDMNGNRENDTDENKSDTSYRWLQNPPNFSMVNLEVPDFEYTMQQYQKQVLDLGVRLMGLIGQALNLPDPNILKKTCEGK